MRERPFHRIWVRHGAVLLAAIAIGLGFWIVSSLLRINDWNPTVFLKFPSAVQEEMAYADSQFEDVVASTKLGHDGKFFFMQAMDPFYLSPDEHAAFLDRPSYRAQRMVYPTLAGGFGLLPAQATAWGMLVVNLIALGIGTWLTAKLAEELGISMWFALAFPLNPGVLVSSFIDTGDVYAMVFFIGGALFVLRRRFTTAAIFLTFAALSRETMLLAALGVISYMWVRERRVPLVFLLPFAATGAWWLYLRVRLGFLEDSMQDVQAIGAPFKGFYEAFQIWIQETGHGADMLIGVLLMVAGLLIAWRLPKQRSLIGFMTVGFTLVAVLMVKEVWVNYFDSARALAPILTSYVLMVPGSRTRSGAEAEELSRPVSRT